MESFKIELFKKEHNIDFISYNELTLQECNHVLDKISVVYNLNKERIDFELASIQTLVDGLDASNNFDLLSALKSLGVNIIDNVFINWYCFEKIDNISLHQLSSYFYDIWFPIADDIDLFDETLAWVLTIRHDGRVFFVRALQ